MLFDFHTHTNHSPDGYNSLDEMCKAAIDKGILKIAITDHYEAMNSGVFFDTFDPIKIKDECDVAQKKYKDKLEILYGVELGQPQFDLKNSRYLLDTFPFDFVIGSVHILKGDSDLYTVDYQSIDCDAIFLEYMEELLSLAKSGCYDVVGHLTYPLRYMYERLGKTINLKKYEPLFRQLFQIIKEKGKGIELNMSGLRQKIAEPMPPLYLLKLYKECGGEIITVGSDAHKTEDLGKGIQEGYSLLLEAGFSYVTVFKERKFEMIALK